MALYSLLLKNFPQFIVIHTVKGFGIVNKAEIDVFLKLSSFLHDQVDVGNLISGYTQYTIKFVKFSSGHRIGKGQFSCQSQRKALLKNVQTTAQLHSFHTLAQ